MAACARRSCSQAPEPGAPPRAGQAAATTFINLLTVAIWGTLFESSEASKQVPELVRAPLGQSFSFFSGAGGEASWRCLLLLFGLAPFANQSQVQSKQRNAIKVAPALQRPRAAPCPGGQPATALPPPPATQASEVGLTN